METATHRQEIIRQFSLQAVPFAQHQAHSQQESFDFIREMARLDGSQRLLDAGCGPGLVCCALAPDCKQATGVDVTAAMIAEAKRRATEEALTNTQFIEGSIDTLPFGDGEFDVTVSRYVFHHLENPAQAFSEMLRVTRPGGRVVVCDAVPPTLCRVGYDEIEKMRDASHTSALTLEEFVSLGEGFQLGEVAIRRFGVPMEFDSLLGASFPEGEKEELRQMIRADIGKNTRGFAARMEDEKCFITFPIAVLGWTKRK